MTHYDLIAKLGGPVVVAQALGLRSGRVYNWGRAHRGIPGAYWPAIIKLAEKKKLRVVALTDVRPNPLVKAPRLLAESTLRRQSRRAAAVIATQQ